MHTTTTTESKAPVTTHAVRLEHGQLHVEERPGNDPAFVLMHGFPDDSRIYDRLTPLLAPRRVVSFDFLGHGRSDRPEPGALQLENHQEQLAAVLDALAIEHAALVAHDASGPVAIDLALDDPSRIDQLLLLNTYYGHAPMLRLPEMIRLFADPHLTPLADAIVADPGQLLWLLQHTARQFGAADELDPDGIEASSIVPQFFGDSGQADALPSIRAWTSGLYADLDRHDQRIAAGELAALDLDVTLLFGDLDPYLSRDLARHLAAHLQHAQMHIVQNASHWPQWEQPQAVAERIGQLLAP